jgi:methylamine methyltransferase corrinoid protein reductive activase
MLAVPGVIADLHPEPPYHRIIVLNADMLPEPGSLIDLKTGRLLDVSQTKPIGITGTGTIALLNQALEINLIAMPRINTVDAELHLGDGLYFTEADLLEAGKAIGAVRAGHLTLCHEAGITLEEIQTAYLSGASGTYVDALKAQRVGLIPPRVRTICQVGNTSLAMARDLAIEPNKLEMMRELAGTLQETHCVFASSKAFQNVYILELSYWTEGMPMTQYRRFLNKYGLPDLLPINGIAEVIRTVQRDIADLGRLGLTTITDIGCVSQASLEACCVCLKCVEACPTQALTIMDETRPATFTLAQARCNGVACRRCERACPEKVFELNRFFTEVLPRRHEGAKDKRIERG